MTLSEVQALMERYDALDVLRAEVDSRHATVRATELGNGYADAVTRWVNAMNRLSDEAVTVRQAFYDALMAEVARA